MMSTMPLRAGHFRVLATASLGQLIGTALATTVGVVIPLMQIVGHPELSAAMQGLIGSANLVGIAVGSAVLGPLADRIGYLQVFRACPLLILAAALVSIFFPALPVLLVCLFAMGFGIGGEYSLDSGYVSEVMPLRWRSTMVGVAKAACALGNIIAAAVCFLVLSGGLSPAHWPQLMWIIAVIAAVMFLSRLRFVQSPLWLLEHGRKQQAEVAAERLLGPDVRITLAAALPTRLPPSRSRRKLPRAPSPPLLSSVPTGAAWCSAAFPGPARASASMASVCSSRCSSPPSVWNVSLLACRRSTM